MPEGEKMLKAPGRQISKTTPEGEKIYENCRPSDEELSRGNAEAKKAEQEFIDKMKKSLGIFNPPKKSGGDIEL